MEHRAEKWTPVFGKSDAKDKNSSIGPPQSGGAMLEPAGLKSPRFEDKKP
jgi:hypothetical protein